MVGRKLLRAAKLRLRQAFQHQATDPFGGTSACLLGDSGQLPPVTDRPIFNTAAGGSRLSEDGRASFQAFTKAIVLRRLERIEAAIKPRRPPTAFSPTSGMVASPPMTTSCSPPAWFVCLLGF